MNKLIIYVLQLNINHTNTASVAINSKITNGKLSKKLSFKRTPLIVVKL